MGNGELDLNRNIKIKNPNKKGINKWPTSFYLFKHFGSKGLILQKTVIKYF